MTKRILIVDDLGINRRILDGMLRKDYDILEAAGGEEALEILFREGASIAAVLLDISMPGVDGYEVLRRVRSDPALAQLPVVMITGSEDEEARRKSLSLGANDFVMKPYSSSIIKHCLENNIALREAAATVRAMQRDRLTGLYNREAFFDEVQKTVTAHAPGHYIIACFDIDKFKVINDQYGTQKGDEVLRHTAEAFREGFEPCGGICCRVFGDDFAVLYPTSFGDTAQIEAIRERASRVEGLILPILFSIGRYVVDDLSLSPSAMYDRAVLAAETIKGRYDAPVAVYDETMRERLLREQEIVMEMEDALKERQFEVWFQPQYNHSTEAQIGAEALVRWRHPRKGLIPPGDFIPVFEQNGFVYTLDKFVWEEVCRCLRRWLDEGRSPLPVSVNISRHDIYRPDLVAVITGLVAKYDLPVDMLCLEVTESAFTESSQQIVAVIKELVARGFTVELDDFGSGYSSLNTLKDVPAQILKLDMKFLESSGQSSRGGNIVESVVRMAKWLGMSVIAEGVETLTQADYLRSIGCSYLQGYLYAKPMDVRAYEEHCRGVGKEERLLALETVENLDNNAFWDPQSMDTLIFNSYIGGACIYEYYRGNIELLRATEKYAQVIGSAGMTVEDALRLNWAEHLDEASGARVVADLEESIATRKEVTGEYVFLDLPGCPHETYLRSTMRVIAAAGARYLVYCTNENITAQRQSEKRERQVAEEMRLIMQNISGGICAAVYQDTGDTRILFANDRFYSLYGYTREQFAAERRGVAEMIHPDDREKTVAAVRRLVRERGTATYEYRCFKRDGSLVHLRCNNSVTSFAGIGETVLLSVTTDTTELALAQQKERQSAEQLRAIMENINAGVSATVVDGERIRVLFANDRHYAQLGYTKSQYEAQFDGVPANILAEDRAMVMERCRTVSETGKPDAITFRIRRRDGAVRWMRSSISAMAYPGEREPVQLAVVHDITAQMETEQQVRRLSDQMQAIMDNVDLGIIAAVVEGGAARYLFANDHYYGMLGYTKAQFAAEIHSPYQTVAPEDQERVRAETVRINRDGGSTVLVYEAVTRDGRRRSLRSAISIGRLSGIDQPVQLSILRDITEEVATETRERRAAEQVQVIMRDVECGITASVLDAEGRIQSLFANDKFYAIHGYTREQYRLEATDRYAAIHPDDREWARGAILAAYASQTPAQLEYRLLRRDGAVRWIRVGISSTHFTGVAQNVHICIFTDITAAKKAEEEVVAASKQLRAMVDDMPGGFARLRVAPDGDIRPLYLNAGFSRLVGMDNAALMKMYAQDALAGVHPDDVPIVRDVVARMLENGEAHSARYRLRHGNGGYVWLSIFGRVTRAPSGECFLNIYYTDATERVREEERQKELLNNLPGGAGLYEYADGQISVIHLNKRYWQLVGRELADYAGVLPPSALPAEDMTVVRRELASAIAQKRDMVCDIRLLREAGGYRPVHLLGRIVPTGEGRYSVYTVFTPIDGATLSYQQMLPLLLSAMMDSTSDMAFAKDMNFRYICASRAFANMVGRANANDIVGKTDYDLFEAGLAEKYRRDDAAMLQNGGAIVDAVEAIPAVNGAPHYSSTSKYILRDGAGALIGLYGVGRDVTKTVVQDSQLKLVNDSIPGGLATYVCVPGEFSAANIRLTYYNDGFCRLFGFSREEYDRRAAAEPADMLFAEDRPTLIGQWQALMERDTPIDCLYRTHVRGGGYKWISHKAVAADRGRDRVVVNSILQDVTDQRELIEQLRISEEENHLAVRLGGNVVGRYVVAERTLNLSPDVAAAHSLPASISGVPEEPVRLGMIAPDSAAAYRDFFYGIRDGRKTASALFQQRYSGTWRWMEAKSSTIFADDGKPVKAVISFCDATERLERETVYKKWQQSLEDRPLASYSLFRCNLNNVAASPTAEGTLLTFDFERAGRDFNERARSYVRERVYGEDREAYAAFANSDTMLASYYRGKRAATLEYRERLADGRARWLRLTVDLVEYPNSTEVEAYLMYEDIDAAKRAELQTKALSQTDSLTGLLNRATFAARVGQIVQNGQSSARHALLMLDLDGFKQVNDVFGHGAGDRTLADIAVGLRELGREGDLAARLGGDEFLVFLRDIPSDRFAADMAGRICALARRAFSMEVRISGSVGIALAPADGTNFDALYKKADCALYYVKGSGKDNYVFYNEGMADEHLEPEADGAPGGGSGEKKRRMLIVEDNALDHALLQNIFREDFIIEKARDGASALIRLRHYGSAISVVLLDLMMPGMDGFTVLAKMQASSELRAIPVLIVSGDESRETCLKAIRKGATDFLTKPVDPDLLRIRVHSAVSRAENERLRAKNRLLEVQNAERARCESALESAGIAFVEYDWPAERFHYYPAIGNYLLGVYDERPLWRILLCDEVADAQTVEEMRQLARTVAEDKTRAGGSRVVRLKTPKRTVHRFRMHVRRLADESPAPDRWIITLNDLDYEGDD